MLIHNADITGSLLVNGTRFNTGSFSGSFTGAVAGTTATASYVEYNNVANKPALVSGSSQITYSGLTGIPSGIVSGSSQVSFNGIVDKPTLVSGSEQISFNGIVDKPTLVSGSSQITYSGLTGIPSGIVSGSAQVAGFGIFATTGSNQFNGNQSITGSLTVTGQVVAQTLNVQQVTSSIVFSSGSNIFGNSLANTQQFTGSLQVTGSNLNANVGSVIIRGSATGATADASANKLVIDDTENGLSILSSTAGAGYINFGDSANNSSGQFIYDHSADALRIFTSGSERMRITSVGNIGIGTNSPVAATNYIFTTTNGSSGSGYITQVNGTTSMYVYSISTESRISEQRTLPLVFETSGTERMRITSGGNVLIGSTSGTTLNSLTNQLSVSSTTYNLFDISRFSNNAFGPNFYLVKSRNGSIGGNTIVENGDNLGNITWVAANGTGFTDAAAIKAEVDGVPGASNDMPGRLVFSTTADGAGSVTERMRITSGGNVGIGITPSYKLDIANSVAAPSSLEPITLRLYNGSDGGSAIYFQNTVGGQSKISFGVESAGSGTDDTYLGFSTGANTALSERMRITSGGNVGIGTDSPSARFQVNGNVRLYTTSGDGNELRGIFNVGGAADPLSFEMYKADAGTIGTYLTADGVSYFNGGNIGIGSTSVTNGTTFGGGGQINRLKVQSTNYTCLEINGSTSGGSIQFTYGTNLPNQVAGLIGYNYGSGTVNDFAIFNVLSGNLIFGTNNAERMRINSGGNVSIGTISNSAALHVASSTATATAPTLFLSQNGYGQIAAIDKNHGMIFRGYPTNYTNYSATATDVMSFYEYGDDFRFYRKTDANDMQIQVQFLGGTIYARNTTVQSLSDIRTKENIRPSIEGLDVITQLNPVRFDFKEGYSDGKKNQLGFIAQEVETIFPDAVSQLKVDNENEEPLKTVGPGALIPVLVKAIQELKAELDTAKTEIQLLKQQ